MPASPIKMMRYRGSDDPVIGYGHFSETRRVRAINPIPPIPPISRLEGQMYTVSY